jgi:hypothetical protein
MAPDQPMDSHVLWYEQCTRPTSDVQCLAFTPLLYPYPPIHSFCPHPLNFGSEPSRWFGALTFRASRNIYQTTGEHGATRSIEPSLPSPITSNRSFERRSSMMHEHPRSEPPPGREGSSLPRDREKGCLYMRRLNCDRLEPDRSVLPLWPSILVFFSGPTPVAITSDGRRRIYP